jgi:hypothetical protein
MSAWSLLLVGAGCFLISCQAHDPDAVTQLFYARQALEQRVLRRIDLVSAGVPLRGPLAVDSVWTHVLGYTFIARGSQGADTGILRIRVLRNGVPLRRRSRAVSRAGLGRYRLSDGVRIIDVFTPMDDHLGSVAADTAMTGRRILEHLGCFRRQSEHVDRCYMETENLQRWRWLLPVVLQSGGYGPLLIRKDPRRQQETDPERAPAAPADSLFVSARRYTVEELPEFTLVGQDRTTEGYRHVFNAGGDYIMTGVWHGSSALKGPALLAQLGLSGSQDHAAAR